MVLWATIVNIDSNNNHLLNYTRVQSIDQRLMVVYRFVLSITANYTRRKRPSLVQRGGGSGPPDPSSLCCFRKTATTAAFNYNISKSDKRRFCKKSSLPPSLSPLVLPNVKYVTLVFHLMNCCIIMSMHLNEWIRARTYMCLHKWENQIDLLLKLAEFMADSKGTIREILLSCRDTLPLPPSSSTI